VADARKVKRVAPRAGKTDRVDARVLAELCRRDLVPALWIPALEERALRERLARRMHLVRLRTSARTASSGCSASGAAPAGRPAAGGRPRGHARRARRARRLAALRVRGPGPHRGPRRAHRHRRGGDRPLAREDARARLLTTIPGVGRLLGLTIAVEVGEVARLRARASSSATPAWPRGCASPARARAPARSRWPAPRRCAGRPSRPRSRPGARATPASPPPPPGRAHRQGQPGQRGGGPQGARRRLARAPSEGALRAGPRPPARSCPGQLPLSSGRLTAPYGIEKPGQLRPTRCARAPKEN
jgi:hypothetical protein